MRSNRNRSNGVGNWNRYTGQDRTVENPGQDSEQCTENDQGSSIGLLSYAFQMGKLALPSSFENKW